MRHKFKSFTIILLLLATYSFAQTGIGTSTPHASAKLHVSATDKGFLPPRVNLTAATDATTIPSPAEGLLVYNLGSVGLQAGYYYWNGANWATIATGTTAGNAVIASNLVKLYGEAWSSATGKIGNTNGYTFTVPVSGRYLFDFSSITYGGTSFTINFYVRQGTTNIGSDGQVSTNNGVRVEYNGKVEVNLQVGVTYNVYISSSNPNRGSEDYDRVYYKMVAGNLPVNQHMAERNIQLNNNFLSNDGDNEGIRIDNSGNVGIGTGTPTARLNLSGGGIKLSSGLGNTSTRPTLNTTSIGNYEIRGVGGETSQVDTQDDGFLRLSAGGGSNVNTQSSIDITGYSTVADMSNNIVMRTGGTERLRIDPGGNVNITGKINVSDPTGNVVTKVSGRVTSGNFLTLDNLKFGVTTSEPRGLAIATVTGTSNLYVQGIYVNGLGSINGSRTIASVAYTTTTTGSPFGWSFGSAGDTIIYHFTDVDIGRMYRVTLVIMSSYINNFISIERLL